MMICPHCKQIYRSPEYPYDCVPCDEKLVDKALFDYKLENGDFDQLEADIHEDNKRIWDGL